VRRDRAPGTATTLRLTRQEVDHYHRDGFVIRRGLFAPEEAAALLRMASSDAVVTERAHGRVDASGFISKLSLWNYCGVNIYGAAARAARLIDNAETLLSGSSHGGDVGEEAYHYHTKVMIKEPHVGGAWEWHQDYGYWYANGNMFPKMLSAVIALNEHTEENGAMRVLKGSHKVGRVTHVTTGSQAGAEEERVAQARAMFEEVSALLRPGDVLFFHCNLFHASRRNTSVRTAHALEPCFRSPPPPLSAAAQLPRGSRPSCFLLPTSYFLLPTSYFVLRTSYFVLRTSHRAVRFRLGGSPAHGGP
jgi:hypothetical protein